MAKPDCDDGWLRYAHELDAAMAVGDFNKGPRIVVHEVLGQVFGPAKMAFARLSPTEIARRTGMSREQISRAVGELVDSGVLEKRDDGSFRFIKDYETWTRNSQPRLSPQEVWYCRDAPARARAFWVGKSSVARDEIVTDNCQNRDKTVTERVTKLSRNPSPPKNPLLGVRIKRDKTTQESGGGRVPEVPEEVKILTASPAPTMPDGTYDPKLCPPYPVNGAVLTIRQGPYELTDADARDVFVRLWVAFGKTKICQAFFEEQKLHPAPRWVEAICELFKSGLAPYSFSLVRNKAGELASPRPKPSNGRPAAKAEPAAPRLPSLSESDPEAFADYKRRTAAATEKGPKS